MAVQARPGVEHRDKLELAQILAVVLGRAVWTWAGKVFHHVIESSPSKITQAGDTTDTVSPSLCNRLTKYFWS